ncbi:MAG: hypothetical protein ACRDSN_21710, partial [Pseudonocardiaceae bacterium]
IGTGHRVITLLSQWGILQVCTGRRSIVLPANGPQTPAAVSAGPETARPQHTGLSAQTPAVHAGTADSSTRRLLTLELVHLGISIRTMRTQADPDDFETLQQLMLDAVRRAGGDRERIGDYELCVRLPDHGEPVTTVVIAA